ncbi:hypothetical protein [Azonexus sp. IMCC34839]|uniref:hypothetical protein n=1 Tax=Azonexus sp. IMCC34839 TaxID=3133695 RepID=UPI00399A1C0F
MGVLSGETGRVAIPSNLVVLASAGNRVDRRVTLVVRNWLTGVAVLDSRTLMVQMHLDGELLDTVCL